MMKRVPGLLVVLGCAVLLGLSPAPAWSQGALPQVEEAASGLYVEFGRGVQLRDESGDFKLTLRGRLQSQLTLRSAEEEAADPVDVTFQVRRARLVFLGELERHDLELYIQLGVGPNDVERGAEVPLRDGVITWSGARDASLRFGQMKVPFNRERLVSSSALQMVDRSLSNAELNLDRDVGVQVFSQDLAGIQGLLGYQLGVYGGEGRNRVGEGAGLLYVGRLQINPLGPFADTLVEADLKRLPTPRLSLGLAGGYQQDAARERATTGADYPDDVRFNLVHAAADLLFKWSGLSLQVEAITRLSPSPVRHRLDAAGLPLEVRARAGAGFMAQAGYLWPSGLEASARWSEVRPLGRSALVTTREGHLGLGYYFNAHNLKLQSDYGLRLEDAADPRHEGRVQVQFYF